MVKYVKASDDYSNEESLNDIKRVRDNEKILIDTYKETRDDGPKVCADRLIEKLGINEAKEIIAYMTVVHGDWDARIDDKVYSWANTICPYDGDVLRKSRIYYCDEIHPANFDMIAKYVMKS